MAKCEVPPAGWRCTREAGHDGPCAALPTDIKERDRDRYEWYAKLMAFSQESEQSDMISKQRELYRLFADMRRNNVIVATVFDAYLSGGYPSFEVCLLDMVHSLDRHNSELQQQLIRIAYKDHQR